MSGRSTCHFVQNFLSAQRHQNVTFEVPSPNKVNLQLVAALITLSIDSFFSMGRKSMNFNEVDILVVSLFLHGNHTFKSTKLQLKFIAMDNVRDSFEKCECETDGQQDMQKMEQRAQISTPFSTVMVHDSTSNSRPSQALPHTSGTPRVHAPPLALMKPRAESTSTRKKRCFFKIPITNIDLACQTESFYKHLSGNGLVQKYEKDLCITN